MLENCCINEWEAAKHKLRNQSFVLNEEICPDVDSLVRRFDLKKMKNKNLFN